MADLPIEDENLPIDPTKRLEPRRKFESRIRGPNEPLTEGERARVLRAVRAGFGIGEAAELIGLRGTQLQKLLANDLDFLGQLVRGRREGDLELAERAFTLASEGEPRMLAYMLKIRLGWGDDGVIPTPLGESSGSTVEAIKPGMSDKEAALAWAKIRNAAVVPDLTTIEGEKSVKNGK